MVINAINRRSLPLQTANTCAQGSSGSAGAEGRSVRPGAPRGTRPGRAEGRLVAHCPWSPAGRCQVTPGEQAWSWCEGGQAAIAYSRPSWTPTAPALGSRAGGFVLGTCHQRNILRQLRGEGRQKKEKNPQRGTRQRHMFLSLPLPALAGPSAADGKPEPRWHRRRRLLKAATPDPLPRGREPRATQHRRRLPLAAAGPPVTNPPAGGGRAAPGSAPRPPSVSGRGGAGRGGGSAGWRAGRGGGAEAAPTARVGGRAAGAGRRQRWRRAGRCRGTGAVSAAGGRGADGERRAGRRAGGRGRGCLAARGGRRWRRRRRRCSCC